MSSTKKIQANRQNGLRARGPVTTAGKEKSAQNSRKHGFFARRPYVSEKEKPEFDALRRGLLRQFAPRTPMQRVAFERVAYSCWRCALSERLETQALKAFFGDQNGEAPIEAPVEKPVTREGYLTNSQALRDAIRFLTFLERDVESFGSVRDELKDDLIRVFGIDCFEDFTRWTPMSRDAILLADQLVQHAKIFRKPLPDLEQIGTRVVIDPQQGTEMVVKLIGQKKRYLEDILSIQRSGIWLSAQNANPAEFAPRFFTTAMRDMQHTVQWFQELKAQGL